MSVTRGVAAAEASAVAGSLGREALGERGIEQAMGVVEGRPEDLAAGISLKVDETRRCTCIAPVSTGSVAPKRGSVARKARTRKIASIRSPRACLMASAASSRSYERAFGHDAVDAEAESCSEIWSSVTSGTLSVAAPLMRQQAVGVLDGALAALDGDIHALASLAHDARGARDRDDGIVRDQHDIDAARKQRRVDGAAARTDRRLDRGA